MRALIFDLDDTLLVQDRSDDEARVAACLVASARHGLDPAALAAGAHERARRLWLESPAVDFCHSVGISSTEGLWAGFAGADPHLQALRAWAPTYRRETWRSALEAFDVDDDDLAATMAEVFMTERRARQVVFPEAEAVLRDLKRDHRVGLLTNGAPDLQREKLAGSGLGKYFDAVIVSGDLGYGKPDPRVFMHLLGLLKTPPSDAVMVGDNPSRDIAGARAAGVYAVWIDRGGDRKPDAGSTPDARIDDLRALRSLLP